MSSRRGVPRSVENRAGRRKPIPRKPNAPKELGILSYKADINWRTWSKVAEDEITIPYGILCETLSAGEWLDLPEVDFDDLDLNSDPHEIARTTLHQRIIAREKQIARIHEDEPKLYAYIWKHLSAESREAVKQHKDFDEDAHKGDPLQLWLAIKATHRGGGAVIDETTARTRAWFNYTHARQEATESTVEFKDRFTDLKEVYDATGNVELPAADVASHFLNALDRSRYSQFLANLENDKAKGDAGPVTLNDAFQRAVKFVVPKPNHKIASGAAFHTVDSMRGGGKGRGRGGSVTRGGRHGRGHDANRSSPSKPLTKNDQPKNEVVTSNTKTDDSFKVGTSDKQSNTSQSSGKGRKVVICYACGQEGHYKWECEWNLDDNNEPSGFGAFVRVGLAFASTHRFPPGAVLLDNQCDMSVVSKKLLKNIRQEKSYISTLADAVGHLDGFFDCRSSDDLVVSVLCFADVAALYPTSYQPLKSFTVHATFGDLVFYLQDKLFVGDMSARLNQDGRSFVTTIQDKESEHTKSEVKRAKEAWKLICNSGYSSEHDALGLVSDGNILGVPITAQDVRRAFEIYGKPAAHVRGRRTAHKPTREERDVTLCANKDVPQSMYGDIMHVRGKQYLICLTLPLGLATVVPLKSLFAHSLGQAVLMHVKTLQNKGFFPTIIYLDAQKGFIPLAHNIPGLEVDIAGAGDHNNSVDLLIRHIKEIIRSQLAALPWRQPKPLDEDLVQYAVGRKNIRRAPNSIVCPIVSFMGMKPSYKKILELSYGDNVEMYNPAITSNNVEHQRTEPGIALWPTWNINGSWTFFSLQCKTRVCRSNWVLMPTSQSIIDAMNAYADACDSKTAVVDESTLIEPIEQPLPRVEEVQEVDEHQVADLEEDEIESDDVIAEALGYIEQELDEDGLEEIEEDNVQAEAVLEDVPPRRSARLVAGVRRPERYRAFHTSVKKGLQEYGKPAYTAVVDELKQLLVNMKQGKKPLEPVHRCDLSARQLKRIIRSLMFLKTKFDGMERFEKIKARLVADGSQQDRKLYPDTYSLTVMLQSVFMSLAIAASEYRKIVAADIGCAYLNADRNSVEGEELIMELEPTLVRILATVAPDVKPYIDDKGKMLVKLNRALYGTLDAAKLWYEKLTGVLRSMGFAHNSVDPCVMNKVVEGKQSLF